MSKIYKTAEVVKITGLLYIVIAKWAQKNGVRKTTTRNGDAYAWTDSDVEAITEHYKRKKLENHTGIEQTRTTAEVVKITDSVYSTAVGWAKLNGVKKVFAKRGDVYAWTDDDVNAFNRRNRQGGNVQGSGTGRKRLPATTVIRVTPAQYDHLQWLSAVKGSIGGYIIDRMVEIFGEKYSYTQREIALKTPAIPEENKDA